jgi:hypothetical protein
MDQSSWTPISESNVMDAVRFLLAANPQPRAWAPKIQPLKNPSCQNRNNDLRPSHTAPADQRQMDQRNIGATIAGQLGEVETAHMVATHTECINLATSFHGGPDGR